MNPFKENLPTMYALARERTELSRVQLASMLADMFISDDHSLSLREEELVNELIDQLMANSNQMVRHQLVGKFADVTRMPRRMASNLALDSIDVARAILVSNPNLTDNDLIHVVENTSLDHALAIAERAQISEAVADALVTTGDARVMQVVAENLGAHLSQRAIGVLSEAAHYTGALRQPILQRPEISAEDAMKLYWWVEQDLRRYTLKRFGITSGQIDKALAFTITAFLDAHAHEKFNDGVMTQVADWMQEHGAATIHVLPQVLRMGHFRLFNMLLSRLSNLSLTLVDTIVSETGGRGLASISRALGIDKAGFVSLFLLSRGGRPGDQAVHPRELSHALATFDRMTPAIAKDLLHSWNVNPEYFAKHKQEAALEENSFY
jgi:uncharacterized protein (DUF2336 family)